MNMPEGPSFDAVSIRGIGILVGGFGSGKTEIAINLCMSLALHGHRAALVDIDLVKPLFRSREARQLLGERGIRTVCCAPEYEYADMPALSPEIEGTLGAAADGLRTIVDVGGDDVGATALGRYRMTIMETGYEMLMVVNPFRPFTSDVASVVALSEAVSSRAGLRITGLVSNPNLGNETMLADVERGHQLVCRISSEMSVPIRFVGIWERLLGGAPPSSLPSLEGVPRLPIRQYMLPPWLRDRPEAQEG